VKETHTLLAELQNKEFERVKVALQKLDEAKFLMASSLHVLKNYFFRDPQNWTSPATDRKQVSLFFDECFWFFFKQILGE
jgi:hypothetical protein